MIQYLDYQINKDDNQKFVLQEVINKFNEHGNINVLRTFLNNETQTMVDE
jgi:hypothetical protein